MMSLRASLRRSRVFRRLTKNRVAVVALVFLILMIIVAVFARWFEPFDPNVQDLNLSLQGPGWSHLLGTDFYGRDTLSRLIAATPVTLTAAAQGLGIAAVLGLPIGLIAGYLGGLVDAVTSRIADGFLAMPPLLLAIAIVGVLGRGLSNAMIAVGITLAPRFFRVARAAAKSVQAEAYMEAAEADGCSSWRLLWRHVLPNSSGPLLVQASFTVGLVISAEASLSFLGLGVQIPQSSWGSMLHDAFAQIRQTNFGLYPPAVLIVLTIAAFFFVGDGLRDALGRS